MMARSMGARSRESRYCIVCWQPVEWPMTTTVSLPVVRRGRAASRGQTAQRAAGSSRAKGRIGRTDASEVLDGVLDKVGVALERADAEARVGRRQVRLGSERRGKSKGRHRTDGRRSGSAAGSQPGRGGRKYAQRPALGLEGRPQGDEVRNRHPAVKEAREEDELQDGQTGVRGAVNMGGRASWRKERDGARQGPLLQSGWRKKARLQPRAMPADLGKPPKHGLDELGRPEG